MLSTLSVYYSYTDSLLKYTFDIVLRQMYQYAVFSRNNLLPTKYFLNFYIGISNNKK